MSELRKGLGRGVWRNGSQRTGVIEPGVGKMKQEPDMAVRRLLLLKEIDIDRLIWVAVSGSTSPTHLGLNLLALCALPLVPSVISRGASRKAT
jgi:hypothetical protein